MLVKTRGIVLKTINYSESSVVAKIYTEAFGLRSYLVHGVRKRKAKVKANHLQLLSLLDLEVYNRVGKEMQHIKELKQAVVFESLPYDIRKSAIALFINELVYQTVREEEPNEALFGFLFHAIQLLDLLSDKVASFHLHFAAQLTKYLGFGMAGSTYTEGAAFDLSDGKFRAGNAAGLYRLNAEESKIFYQLSSLPFEEFQQIGVAKSLRKAILEHLLDYYKLHIPGLKELQSHEVLQEVLA